MKNDTGRHARDYAADLAASGRYSFSSQEARRALGVSADAAKLALNRLIKQGVLASPARGFYVIVPPEYRALGCLPADQFLPALMKRQKRPYYAGLLSAAQYHGAAHHRPQTFQVMTVGPRRAIVCGRVRVSFFVRKNIAKVPAQSFNTPRGTILVSTPEVTAIDLVGYHDRIGGLDQAATVLGDLAEALDPDKLVAAVRSVPVSWVQRLGYLLERVDARDKAAALKPYVRAQARNAVALLPSAPRTGAMRNDDWKLDINAELEPDL
ncbi:MAG: type IV toxin-antitoxin system AbiEi family antitoxin [Alphaproteobacteria bacterium]|nr:type IV toxin-antitoxin system AbiEi family antitoxin domain-containing protein [Alphaproteobacteria bacterium]MDE2112746.1 type IV toxin-antitoxin system AbiEi family antitoxin [Alphaproteobacteria bacterium]MDE2495719.1 type IV toxin-antitoxin system AbiEi family antitoxin [Alphaproteobacteria bacterium]